MMAAISPRRWGLLLAAVLWFGGLSPVSAQWGPPKSAKSSEAVLAAYKEVVAAPSQSTVRLYIEDRDRQIALGTIVSAEGWIITKASLLKGKITVKLKDGKKLAATLVGVENKYDLAMLRVEAKNLKPIKWAHSKTAEV